MYIKGVNLGNWLVLEKWMSPALFEGTTAEDEYYLPRQLTKEVYEALYLVLTLTRVSAGNGSCLWNGRRERAMRSLVPSAWWSIHRRRRASSDIRNGSGTAVRTEAVLRRRI